MDYFSPSSSSLLPSLQVLFVLVLTALSQVSAVYDVVNNPAISTSALTHSDVPTPEQPALMTIIRICDEVLGELEGFEDRTPSESVFGQCREVLQQSRRTMVQFYCDLVTEQHPEIRPLSHWASQDQIDPLPESVQFQSIALHRSNTPHYAALGHVLPYLQHYAGTIRDLLSDIIAKVASMKISIKDALLRKSMQRLMKQLQGELGRFTLTLTYVQYALETPSNSVANPQPTRFLAESVVTVDTDLVELKQQLERVAEKYNAIKCMSADATRSSNQLIRELRTLTGIFYYMLNPSQTTLRARLLSVNMELRALKFMANLTEHPISRSASRLSWSDLDLALSFYVAPENLGLNSTDQPRVKVRYMSPEYCDSVDEALAKLRYPKRTRSRSRSLSFCFRPSSSDSERDRTLQPLILHFHGGGFVAQSSFSHQPYTRRLASSTQVPVLSVDYRLAPEFQYPAPIDDAWLVYQWCVMHGERVLGIDPRRIVVAGDSAGGNIAAALTLRALQRGGVPPPYGVFMAYPALSLSDTAFYPSQSMCLDDFLLSYSFLTGCMNAYVPETVDPRTEWELSPVAVPDELLRQFPRTTIMVGACDPLLDHSTEFAQRLHQLGREIQLEIYKGFGHAFLLFDSPVLGVPATNILVKKSFEHLKALTSSKRNNNKPTLRSLFNTCA